MAEFLRNFWYVAAWSDEVGREPLGRVLLGEYVCLYRRGDGSPVALANRCPHRNLPLSQGRLKDDMVECGYHGLVFSPDGVCVHAPGMAAPPDWARVRRYPVAERHGWVFVWMGDAAAADETSIPAFHARVSDPGWLKFSGHLVVGCGFRLILDNLLDLSHLSYVHASTTGNPELAEQAEISTDIAGEAVRVVRRTRGIPAAPAFARYGRFAGPIDRWQTSRFMPPSYIHVNNGAVDAGCNIAEEDIDHGQGNWGFVVYHALTPESAATTHQFWCMAIPEPMAPPPGAERDRFTASMNNIIAEDTAVYQAQQAAIDLDPEAPGRDVNPRGTLPGDEALLAMRRVLRRLYGAEQQAVKSTERPA